MLLRKRERLIRRIMVVEDEPLVAFDNETLLQDAGYEVVATVDSVAEALRVIAEEPLDLILTDLTLRGEGSGLDVARAARERGVPVLFVTGACPVEARELSMGCLTKPYSDKDMKGALDAIDEHLQGREAKKPPAALSFYG